MNLNYVFTWSLLAAIVPMGLSVWLRLPLPVAAALELAPLLYYFISLNRCAKQQGLSQTAIDSVYYFGFIITIFALAASVLRVYLFGVDGDLIGMVGHFAVGLLATGLALVFRMMLTARTEALNAKDLGESIEDYLRRVNDVVSAVEVSAASFEGLSRFLQDRTETQVVEAQRLFYVALKGSADYFEEHLQRVVDRAARSVESFHESVHAVTSTIDPAAFGKSIETMTVGLNSFSQGIARYGHSAVTAAMEANNQALSTSQERFANHLQALQERNLAAHAEMLARGRELDFSGDAARVKMEMLSLSRAITNFTKKFGEFETRIGEALAAHSGESAQGVIQLFETEVARVAAAADRALASSLNDTERRLQQVSQNLGTGVAPLGKDIDQLRVALDEFRKSLDNDQVRRENGALSTVIGRTRSLLEELNVTLSRTLTQTSIAPSAPSAVNDGVPVQPVHFLGGGRYTR